MRKLLLAVMISMQILTSPARATDLTYVGECVPFARAASGIQIFGDAWTWWDQAAGNYARGDTPRIGAVIVFARSSRLRLGHVAVISRLLTPRVAMITHANWSRRNGARGHTEQDVTIADVSSANDWSAVKVWHGPSDSLGTTVYPVSGFVYGARDRSTAMAPESAGTAAYLSGDAPDYVGALIDAYAR